MRFDFDIIWKKVKLGEILKIKSGMDQKKIETSDGKYNIYGTSGIIGKTNTPIYSKESVGIGRKGTIDKPFYFNEPFWTVDTLFYSEIKSHHVKFIYYLFQTINWKFYNQSTGVPSLTSSVIENININIPSSLEEERKIADFLSEIDERISTQKKILGELESLKNKINTDIYNKIEFNKKCKLKELCSITTGKLDANAMVANGKYRFYTCAENFYYINNYDFDGEALLISGNGANVGYIHYYNGKFNAYQRTYVLQNFKLNAKYINVFLNVFLKHRVEQQKNNGNTPYIKMATLSEMTILIPSIEEQNNIISINDLLNEKISNEKKILSLYDKQKQYLLSKLFI